MMSHTDEQILLIKEMKRLVDEGNGNLFNKLPTTADQHPQDHFSINHDGGKKMAIEHINKVEWKNLLDAGVIELDSAFPHKFRIALTQD